MIGALAAYAGAAWAIERSGRRAPPEGERFDALVVLGCPVSLQDGGASPALRRRLELAARLSRLGHAPTVVVTGGVTRAGFQAEATVSARVLVELGVPASSIVVEDRSRTTLENARFVARLVPGARRVLLVSDAFHLPRARLLFRRYFPEVHGAGALGGPRARAVGALREVPLVALYGLVAVIAPPA